MPKATLVTTAVFAGLVTWSGCQAQRPEPELQSPQTPPRAARIWIPSTAPRPRVKATDAAKPREAEPGISVPEPKAPQEPPASAPKPERRAPRAPLDPHRDRCGRPLVA